MLRRQRGLRRRGEPNEAIAAFTCAQIELDATASHTHEAGGDLVQFDWKEIRSDTLIASQAGADAASPKISCFFPFGTYTISMTIHNTHGATDTASETVVIAPLGNVPGTLVEMYDGAAADLAVLPAKADWTLVLPSTFELTRSVAETRLGPQTLRFLAETPFPGGPITFSFSGLDGAAEYLILIDGAPLSDAGPVGVEAGLHELDVRCAAAPAAADAVEATAAAADVAAAAVAFRDAAATMQQCSSHHAVRATMSHCFAPCSLPCHTCGLGHGSRHGGRHVAWLMPRALAAGSRSPGRSPTHWCSK